MTRSVLTLLLLFLYTQTIGQTKVSSVYTTPTENWIDGQPVQISKATHEPQAEVYLSQPLQSIEGFGTCFNELGWTSLSLLTEKDRETILREMFSPGVGANFTICRMPVGANDFSTNWYSYNETPGDFDMKHFTIAHDKETLIPFIHAAQRYNPRLKIWASPWSPPSWMKYNGHYAARSVLGNADFISEEWGMDLRGINNGLAPEKEGKEGTDMFIQEEKYFKAYTLYFKRFVEAYRKEKINIQMVMPQNEFNSAQVFPSCTWTAAGLTNFVSYLGPAMKEEGVALYFGTMERGNHKLVDTLLTDPRTKPFVSGVGFQWAGKDAIAAIHQQYPNLSLYQTEQECGNSKNDWKHCLHAWDLMKHYLTNGASAYMYWNTSLKQGGISTWGWKQNSLVSVDTVNRSYTYNPEYYLLKHVSHFVKPGARLLATSGQFSDMLAFLNPDKSVVIVVANQSKETKTYTIRMGEKEIRPILKPESFYSFHIQ
ncbi:MAG: glycoside hydrolase family 30 protein [Chitinophagaceae bacterium]|nr:glycoside hydrolase family 30 protein [Chitinophagaceae bacterium]